MISLRPYQSAGVKSIVQSWTAGNRSVLYYLPTGGGKTITFSYLASELSKRGHRVIALAHRVELVEQIRSTMERFGIYAGVQNPNYSPDYSARVQVGSVQTVIRRIHLNHPPAYIILDEAHHATAETWRQVIDAWPNARILGVSATPCRADGVGLGTHVGGVFDQMVMGPSVTELQRLGSLVPSRTICPPRNNLDLSGIKMVAGDFAKGELAARMDDKSVIGDAIAHYREHLDGKRVATFCVNVEHAYKVAEQYRDAGIEAVAIDGKLDGNERKRRLADFAAGKVLVLTSCDLIGEGFDVPAIEGVQSLRPTMSMSLYLQQIGRGLRPLPGKTECVVLDHVGNIYRHGPAERHRDWTLDGEEKAEGKKKVVREESCKQCGNPECRGSYDATEPACPFCGWKAPKKAIKWKDGKLVEWDMEAERAAIAREEAKQATRQTRVDAARELLKGLGPVEKAHKMHEFGMKAKDPAELSIISEAGELTGKVRSSWNFRMAKVRGFDFYKKKK